MVEGITYWEARRGVIRTKKGGRWLPGTGVTSHGYSILDELVGRVSYFQLLIMHVTGVMPEKRLADWLEAIYISLSWPDPRMWPNQIGSLGGTMRVSPVAAVCVGTLASDSGIYGPGTIVNSTEFITQALRLQGEGCSVEEIVEKHGRGPNGKLRAPGFIRPFAKGDERVVPMQGIAEALGYPIGPHLSLAYAIQDYLYEHHYESMNLAGYIVAFLSDQGFSVAEIYRVCSLCVNAGVMACYAEAADHPPESFLPLRCEDIDYCGKPERRVPPG